MTDALFEMREFAPPKPEHAEGCRYCHPNDDGIWPEQAFHEHNHVELTCATCGETSPNRLLFEMNHGTTLGGCWERDALVCTSLHFRLNHLKYDLLHGHKPDARDWTAVDLGWRLAPNGDAVAPAGWPRGLGERSTDPRMLHDCHEHARSAA